MNGGADGAKVRPSGWEFAEPAELKNRFPYKVGTKQKVILTL